MAQNRNILANFQILDLFLSDFGPSEIMRVGWVAYSLYFLSSTLQHAAATASIVPVEVRGQNDDSVLLVFLEHVPKLPPRGSVHS